MTQSATDKLIADNLWRDISEAPRDGSDVLLLGSDESEIKAIADWWHAYANGDGHWEHSENDDGFIPTHFRPLPDDRCANALKIAVEALREAATTAPCHSQGWNEKLQRYESAPISLEEQSHAQVLHMHSIIAEALAAIEREAKKGE